MNRYLIIKNNLVNNIVISENLPVTSSDELCLLQSDYGVNELNTPYDSENNVFLTKFKGQFNSDHNDLTLSLTSSNITLKYNSSVTSILEENINVQNATINNFLSNDSSASFEIHLEETILSSSVEETITISVDNSIKSVDGYSTIVSPLELKYVGSL